MTKWASPTHNTISYWRELQVQYIWKGRKGLRTSILDLPVFPINAFGSFLSILPGMKTSRTISVYPWRLTATIQNRYITPLGFIINLFGWSFSPRYMYVVDRSWLWQHIYRQPGHKQWVKSHSLGWELTLLFSQRSVLTVFVPPFLSDVNWKMQSFCALWREHDCHRHQYRCADDASPVCFRYNSVYSVSTYGPV